MHHPENKPVFLQQVILSRFGVQAAVTRAPSPKVLVGHALMAPALSRLESEQPKLSAQLESALRDMDSGDLRIYWSENMVGAAGLSVDARGTAQLHFDLRLKSITEQAQSHEKWHPVLQDFLYLILVHEASELSARRNAESFTPNLRAELAAMHTEAMAYLRMPENSRRLLVVLMKGFNKLDRSQREAFSKPLLLYDRLGIAGLQSAEGILALIQHILDDPDYQVASYRQTDAEIVDAVASIIGVNGEISGVLRARLNAGKLSETDANRAPVAIVYTKNSTHLSERAASMFSQAAKILKQMSGTEAAKLQDVDRVRILTDFNRKMEELADIKGRLAPNEVLDIPGDLKDVLQSRRLSAFFHIYFQDRGYSLDLSRCNLQDIDLFGATLNGANFSGSDLSGANLIQAQLAGSNFRNAYMLGTFLHRANLSGADLGGANLTGAEIQNADVSNANLRRAFFKNAILLNAELNGVQLHFSDIKSRLWLAEVHRSLDDEWVKLCDHTNGGLKYACRYLVEGRGAKLFDDKSHALNLDQACAGVAD